jgi:hypothetical protein
MDAEKDTLGEQQAGEGPKAAPDSAAHGEVSDGALLRVGGPADSDEWEEQRAAQEEAAVDGDRFEAPGAEEEELEQPEEQREQEQEDGRERGRTARAGTSVEAFPSSAALGEPGLADNGERASVASDDGVLMSPASRTSSRPVLLAQEPKAGIPSLAIEEVLREEAEDQGDAGRQHRHQQKAEDEGEEIALSGGDGEDEEEEVALGEVEVPLGAENEPAAALQLDGAQAGNEAAPKRLHRRTPSTISRTSFVDINLNTPARFSPRPEITENEEDNISISSGRFVPPYRLDTLDLSAFQHTKMVRLLFPGTSTHTHTHTHSLTHSLTSLICPRFSLSQGTDHMQMEERAGARPQRRAALDAPPDGICVARDAGRFCRHDGAACHARGGDAQGRCRGGETFAKEKGRQRRVRA